MRKFYWYVAIFLRKHGLVVAGSVIAAILLFSFALPLVSRFLDFKGNVYIGVIGRYTLTQLPLSIQQEISSGLTKVQLDGSVTPDLAARWNTEDNGKTYRFLLRQHLFWQDGKALVPSDVQFQFQNMQEVTTPNDVVFKLNDPFVPFPTVMSQPLIKIVSAPYYIFFTQNKVVGVGSNQVVSYKLNGQWVQELTVSEKNVRKVYRFYATEDDAISAFKRGEIDFLSDLSSPQDLESWPNVTVKKWLDTSTYLGVFFNTQDDTLKSNDIRQALNYALPKPTDVTRAVGPINPKSWAFADVGKHYDFDEQRAIDRLLTPQVIPHQPMTIELTTAPQFNDEAETIKQSWENLGLKAAQQCKQATTIKDKTVCPNLAIHVDIRITNFPDLSDYQALLIGEQSPSDPDQYALWHSTPQTNFTHYKNVRIDGLLEKGRQTEDQKKRFEIYSEFQQFFSEDAPVIFIQYLYKYDISRKGK